MILLRSFLSGHIRIKRTLEYYDAGIGPRVPFGGGFSPASLFAAGEQGVWFDPSDFSTMFQDAAGTTPVTAVEQPVGLIKDKSGRGNNATQSTSSARPVLSALVNLLEKTEQFDNAYWSKYGTSVDPNTATAPDGTTTADKITSTISGIAFNYVYRNIGTGGANATLNVYAKAGTSNFVCLYGQTSAQPWAAFDLSNGTVASSGNGAATIQSLGNGWYRCNISSTTAAATQFYVIGKDANPITWPYSSGTWASGNYIYIWGADLRPTNQGVNLPVYQRVNTSTDYDTAGFPLYLKFDGVDDSLATGSIDFTGTNKMSVFAAQRKQSDAAQSVIAELSATIASNNGTWFLTAPNSAAANYNFSSKGTTQVDNTVTTYTAPLSGVLTGLGDISAPSNIIRVNGSQAGSSTSSQGTGNYGNYALYVGRRNSASLQWNGNLYGLIVRGAFTSTPQITATENWLRLRGRVY